MEIVVGGLEKFTVLFLTVVLETKSFVHRCLDFSEMKNLDEFCMLMSFSLRLSIYFSFVI